MATLGQVPGALSTCLAAHPGYHHGAQGSSSIASMASRVASANSSSVSGVLV